MNQPERNTEGTLQGGDAGNRIFPIGFFDIFGHTYDSHKRIKRESHYERWWGNVPVDRKIELILSAAIAASAIIQLYTTISNNHSTADQTDKLITASRISASAALQNVSAAQSFAASAQSINQEMKRTVQQLGIQAQELEASRQSSEINSAKSLDTTIENFHQDQRAWIGTASVEPGNFSPTTGFPLAITFANSGKTPAKNVHFSVRSAYKSPERPHGPSPLEVALLEPTPANDVPPQGVLREVLATGYPGAILSPDIVAGLQDSTSNYQNIVDAKGFLFYYGTIEYDDVFGNLRHTNFCIIIMDAKVKTIGFCDKFNDIQ